jgi:hypothetical protein
VILIIALDQVAPTDNPSDGAVADVLVAQSLSARQNAERDQAARKSRAGRSMDACVLDPLSYVAPARIKVLVKPWLPIKRTRYDSFLARLKAVNEVRLSDVPAGSPEELGE